MAVLGIYVTQRFEAERVILHIFYKNLKNKFGSVLTQCIASIITTTTRKDMYMQVWNDTTSSHVIHRSYNQHTSLPQDYSSKRFLIALNNFIIPHRVKISTITRIIGSFPKH